MNESPGAHEPIGRKTPAAGAHIYIGQSNIFFVTVNAKDRIPWIGQPNVQARLEEIWRGAATVWRGRFPQRPQTRRKDKVRDAVESVLTARASLRGRDRDAVESVLTTSEGVLTGKRWGRCGKRPYHERERVLTRER